MRRQALVVPPLPTCNRVALHLGEGAEIQALEQRHVSRHEHAVHRRFADRVAMQRELGQTRQLRKLRNVAQLADAIAMQVEHLQGDGMLLS